MNLEKVYHEIRRGRRLTADELAYLRRVILQRSAPPYELSQAVLSYCHLCPPDPAVASAVIATAMEYVLTENEWTVACTEWIVLALTTDWHFESRLEPVCREVIARWKDESYDSLFRQCAIILGELAAEKRDTTLFERLRRIGQCAIEAGNTSIAEKAAVGCRIAVEGARPSSLQTPEDVAAYLGSVRLPNPRQ